MKTTDVVRRSESLKADGVDSSSSLKTSELAEPKVGEDQCPS
jgi:hypothetical protein